MFSSQRRCIQSCMWIEIAAGQRHKLDLQRTMILLHLSRQQPSPPLSRCKLISQPSWLHNIKLWPERIIKSKMKSNTALMRWKSDFFKKLITFWYQIVFGNVDCVCEKTWRWFRLCKICCQLVLIIAQPSALTCSCIISIQPPSARGYIAREICPAIGIFLFLFFFCVLSIVL